MKCPNCGTEDRDEIVRGKTWWRCWNCGAMGELKSKPATDKEILVKRGVIKNV